MLQTFSGFPVFTISIITTDREVFFFFLSGPFRYLMVGWSTTLSLLARKMVIVMYVAKKKKKKIGKGEIFCSEQQETATCCYSGCC